MWRVSGVSGAWRLTKSDSANSVERSTNLPPKDSTALRRYDRVGGEDVQAESAGLHRHGLADAAESHYTDRLAAKAHHAHGQGTLPQPVSFTERSKMATFRFQVWRRAMTWSETSSTQ